MIRAWICWFVWLAFVLGVNIALNTAETALLLILSVFIPLVSILIYSFVSPHVQIAMAFPESIDKKQTAKGEIRIENRRIVPYLRMSFYLYGKNQITGETIKIPIKISVPPLGTTKLPIKIRDDFCGKIVFSVSPVKAYDAFLLLFRKKEVPVKGSVMVLPNWVSGQLPPVFAGETDIEATEYASDRAGIDRSEPFGYRSYLPGDSFKDIHWKLTQKLGHMMVREGGDPVAQSVVLLLDTSVGNHMPDYALRDSMIEAFVTLSRAFASQGVAHTVAWQDQARQEWISYEIRSEDDFGEVLPAILSASMERDDVSCLEHYWKNNLADSMANLVCVLYTLPPLEMMNDQRMTILLAKDQGRQGNDYQGNAEVISFTSQEIEDGLLWISH